MALVGQLVFGGNHGDVALGSHGALMRLAAIVLAENGEFRAQQAIGALIDRFLPVIKSGVEPAFAHMLTIALSEREFSEVGIWLHDTSMPLDNITVISSYDLTDPSDPEFDLVNAVFSVSEGADPDNAREYMRGRIVQHFERFRGGNVINEGAVARHFQDGITPDFQPLAIPPRYRQDATLFAQDFDLGVADVADQIEVLFDSAIERLPKSTFAP